MAILSLSFSLSPFFRPFLPFPFALAFQLGPFFPPWAILIWAPGVVLERVCFRAAECGGRGELVLALGGSSLFEGGMVACSGMLFAPGAGPMMRVVPFQRCSFHSWWGFCLAFPIAQTSNMPGDNSSLLAACFSLSDDFSSLYASRSSGSVLNILSSGFASDVAWIAVSVMNVARCASLARA